MNFLRAGPSSSFFDDTFRDIVYALRTFRRAPLVAFTIVSTVALGLGLVTVAFTVLDALLFRVDAVPDVHEMRDTDRLRAHVDTVTGKNSSITNAPQYDSGCCGLH